MIKINWIYKKRKLIVNTLPLPVSDSIAISPLCNRIMRDDMESPNPRPSDIPTAFVFRKKGSKIYAVSSADMPIPSSLIRIFFSGC